MPARRWRTWRLPGGYPAERLRLIGVTGTDGKTTTTRLIGSLLEAAGRRCGWYTTADLKLGERIEPNTEHHTTPEADRVQEVLAAMVDAGATCAVLEASSHALAQGRLRGCTFDVGVFTNLSPEHLDYHGSLEAYLEAKARLFTMLGEPTEKAGTRYAVLNADQPASQRLRAVCPVPVVTYGVDQAADVRAVDVQESLDGFHVRVVTAAGDWPLATRFMGRHNVTNWLAAVAVALREGVPVETIQAAAQAIEAPPGRLNRCGAVSHSGYTSISRTRRRHCERRWGRCGRALKNGSCWRSGTRAVERRGTDQNWGALLRRWPTTS